MLNYVMPSGVSVSLKPQKVKNERLPKADHGSLGSQESARELEALPKIPEWPFPTEEEEKEEEEEQEDTDNDWQVMDEGDP
eukprot:9844872-Karenia_brevis.AAC.1